jgi:50S ribosomal subunit-associated GTPase HflX
VAQVLTQYLAQLLQQAEAVVKELAELIRQQAVVQVAVAERQALEAQTQAVQGILQQLHHLKEMQAVIPCRELHPIQAVAVEVLVQ